MTAQLRAGAARREITPPIGSELSGFIARLAPSDAVADPLHVRALVASVDGRLIAIVQADLLGFDRWHVIEVREFAHRKLGIPREAVLLSATHTHSGPGVLPLRGCQNAPYDYQWEIVEKIQEALREARDRLSPATLEHGAVPYSLGVNRRQESEDGVVLGVAPEKAWPEKLDVARLKTGAQDILLFSHACHPYVLGAECLFISGDFPSMACLELEKDGSTVAFFLNGCAGNIAPKSAFEGVDRARQVGQEMASRVRSACDQLAAGGDSTLGWHSATIHLPYLPLPSCSEVDALAEQPERVVRPEEKVDPKVQMKIREAVDDWGAVLKRAVRGTMPLHPVQCEVQALRIGPLALVGISGELFFEIGERVRSASSFRVTWPLGYTNAYCGYIPSREEYPRGGYEVNDSWKYVGTWKIDDSCEARVVEAAAEVLGRLT